MTEEVTTALPAEVVATEQAANVEKTSTEATTEQTQEQTDATENTEAPKKEPWFQKRIDGLTREKYEAKREADEARQEAALLREQIARQQQGDTEGAPIGDVETLATQRARQIVAEQSFNQACNKVYADGKAEFPNFDASLANLHLVGVGREFLELTAASDAGAKLINHLGTDLDEAARIAALPPLLMARELTKLELKLGQPKVKQVSGAPAPISPIAGTKGGSKDLGDPNLSDAEFAELRRKQISQRR